MKTRIDEISPSMYRISTHVPEGPPGGIVYNQFLVRGEESLLFHTGLARLFPAIRDAVATVIDPTKLRWLSSCHTSRPDEYGAMNEWLELAPRAQQTPEGFAAYHKAEIEKWWPVIKGAGIKNE